MSLKGKHVLVTGAGGFIGSHLAEQLVESGCKVRAFTHYNALQKGGWLDESEHRSHMEIMAGDICDRDSVRAAMRDVEVVFHLAALIAIPYSYQVPELYVRTNILGTMNVLQAVREMKVSRLIHTSTSEVYGTAVEVPIKESHPLQGQSPYAASKIGADKMVESFTLSYGVPAVTIRPFNTYGPRQSMRAVIPSIIGQLLKGSRVKLGNLKPTRDLNFVSNTVDGFIRAATAKGAIGEVINIGSGTETSIRELAVMISTIIGRKIIFEEEKKRQRPEASEVMRLVASNRKANDLLKWKPQIGLKVGLKKTIDWMSNHAQPFHHLESFQF